MNFKSLAIKVAVAAALAGSATSALAGSIATGTSLYSTDFATRAEAVSATSVQAVPTGGAVITYTAGSAAVSGDQVTVTLGGTAGARFSKTTTNATAADGAAGHFGTLKCNGGATTLTQSSGTDTTRVFTVPAAGCPTGAYTFEDATLLNSSLKTAGTITISTATNRGTAAVEVAPAATVATVGTQLAATVATGNSWKGQINNAANAKAFVAASTAGSSTTTDTWLIDLDNNASVNAVALEVAIAGVLTINGDFNYLVNGVQTCAALAPTAADDNKVVITDASSGAVIGTVTSASCTQIVVSFSKAEVDNLTSANNDLKVELVNAATGNTLAPQTFSASWAWKYAIPASAVVQTKTETVTAGAQTGSGVTVFVPYMPVGAGVSQILYVTNNTAVPGTVTITSRNSAGTLCSGYSTTAVGARSVVSLSAALAAGLAACGGASSTDKLALTITSTVPLGGLEVYSAYNISGNRVNVINSSNGRNVANGVGSDNANR